ncbi:apolipoprotein N-acyltransferase [Hoeflea marina]|uniref:apolipoprotein N-acyltransferase n=1 Tax=Hoeflea marina TaxID=274592 RepID=UPI000D70A64B
MERLAEKIMLVWGIKRALLSLLAGGLAVLALPPFNFFAVMFVSMPVLVWLLDGASGNAEAGFIGRLRPAFATGWWFGFGYFTAGLWWLGNALLVDGTGAVWALPLAVFGLPAVLALFYGFAAAFARMIWSDGVGRTAALAAGFGLAEYARGVLFTGFPWNEIGYTAMPVPLMMQSAAVVGLGCMTMLAVFVFSAPALVGTRRGAVPGLLLALALFVSHLGYGWHALDIARPTAAVATDPVIRLVQPAIDQSAKWDSAERERNFARLLELTARPPLTESRRPTYIVWPETALPFLLTDNPGALARIADVLQVGQTLITGAVRVEAGQGGTASRYYNSIYVIDDEGEIIAAADKAHLVPFGEYLPFESWFGRIGLAPLAETFGGFSAAEHRSMLTLPGGITALPLICYEAIFPDMAQIGGSSGDLMLNVTNDAWYGMTPGPYQHLRQAQLRAVERRTPLVRAANNGISAVIDSEGRFVAAMALGEQGILDVDLPRARDKFFVQKNTSHYFWLLFAVLVFFGGGARMGNWRHAD